jgi:hypothetical protein
MRRLLLGIALGATLAAPAARAQCSSTGGDCPSTFNVTVPTLPSVTGAPVLDIDAVIQDTGAALIHNPNARVFVTVLGGGPDGGGTVLLPDGGTDFSGTPLTAPLSLATFGSNGGVFTSIWDGGAPLFLGDNVLIVSALKPSGARADSVPRTVRFQPVTGGGDGGTPPSTDGGTILDGGTTPDGGTITDGGCTGTGPDGGPICGVTGSALSTASDSGGCSTAAGGPPSFLLMALAVMLAGAGRRAMRS